MGQSFSPQKTGSKAISLVRDPSISHYNPLVFFHQTWQLEHSLQTEVYFYS